MLVSSHSTSRGEWSGWSNDVRVPAFSAGLQFGLSVFEGMQAHLFDDGARYKVQFLSDHYQRLCASASVLGIEVPDLSTFEAGLNAAIEQILKAEQRAPSAQRLYLRSLHFSGCEDIFPRSGYPFFCNIFARLVPKPTRPEPLQILADQAYIRATPGSRLGAAKSAVNYAQLVELDQVRKLPGTSQRLWLSPQSGHPIEELDTMGVGLMLADGTFCVPPPSNSKLPSITLANLVRQLARRGETVQELSIGLIDLATQLDDGTVVGLFAASTGKGLGIATQIQIGSGIRDLTPPRQQVDTLWRAYVDMYEVAGR